MATIDDLLAVARNQKLPPVESWQPDREGDIDIRIGTDGRWYHEGTEFKRQALVKLFAGILRLDADGYCLVTPAEKLRISVDDAPFVAVDMEIGGSGAEQRILFRTNVDDHVLADARHPIIVEDRNGEPRPYVEVRNGLRALIARSVFYRLVELGQEDDGKLSVVSAGEEFLLGTV